jgi:hypothetical protein
MMILVKTISKDDEPNISFGIETPNNYQYRIGYTKEKIYMSLFHTFRNASSCDVFCINWSHSSKYFSLSKKGIYFNERCFNFKSKTVFEGIFI